MTIEEIAEEIVIAVDDSLDEEGAIPAVAAILKKHWPSSDEGAIEVLIAAGWRKGYVHGHGNDEPVSDGDEVIGDVEKVTVLVPPDALFAEPISMKKYFGW